MSCVLLFFFLFARLFLDVFDRFSGRRFVHCWLLEREPKFTFIADLGPLLRSKMMEPHTHRIKGIMSPNPMVLHVFHLFTRSSGGGYAFEVCFGSEKMMEGM
ncbi:hypothetical protein AABB24_030804 [Solanum stoloniferum]|uniref:Secreted protein n=1 Tax=Solanum stoloniferum TaxID=62892 RepID=A0ABD2RSB4_9SOLN